MQVSDDSGSDNDEHDLTKSADTTDLGAVSITVKPSPADTQIQTTAAVKDMSCLKFKAGFPPLSLDEWQSMLSFSAKYRILGHVHEYRCALYVCMCVLFF